MRFFAKCLGLLSALGLLGLVMFIQSQARKSSPVRFLVAFDPTPKYADQLVRQGAAILPGLKKSPKDRFALYAVDHGTSLIANSFPQDPMMAAKLLRSIPMVRQTHVAGYFEALVPLVEGSHLPVVVIFISDGLSDEEAADAAKRIRAAALRLKSCSQLKSLILCGISRDVRVLPGGKVREGLPELLASIQDRLVVLPYSTLKPGQVFSAVKSVRQSLPTKEN